MAGVGGSEQNIDSLVEEIRQNREEVKGLREEYSTLKGECTTEMSSRDLGWEVEEGMRVEL